LLLLLLDHRAVAQVDEVIIHLLSGSPQPVNPGPPLPAVEAQAEI